MTVLVHMLDHATNNVSMGLSDLKTHTNVAVVVGGVRNDGAKLASIIQYVTMLTNWEYVISRAFARIGRECGRMLPGMIVCC